MIVCIVDTSVLCELLAVPGKSVSEEHDAMRNEFERRWRRHEQFLLPIVTIVETGNHIAHASDGTLRRATAQRFVELVRDAIDGRSPFTPTPEPTTADLRRWLDQLVDDAARGIGVGDRSLIDTWQSQRELHPRGRVYIWSKDRHLESYDTEH